MESPTVPDPNRFGGIARVVGDQGLRQIADGHVAVIGVGGVGSWAAEALARSGVGRITLIDGDDVCVTNINRQLPALDDTVGRPKVEVLAERIARINPVCSVAALQSFIGRNNAAQFLHAGIHWVLDATDRVSVKALILARCREAGLRAVTVGGAGGKRDASMARIADFGKAGGDELIRLVRRKLRRDYGWTRGEGNEYGIPTVFSPEPLTYPRADGGLCGKPETGASLRMDCSSGLGALCPVTGTFGFLAAGEIIRQLAAR